MVLARFSARATAVGGAIEEAKGALRSQFESKLAERQGPVFTLFAALQLQMTVPSARSSHCGSELQLSEVFISVQLSAPTHAHRRSPSGVWKQLKIAQAAELDRNAATSKANKRRAIRISPSITWRAFNYQ